jgi:hypothetical protein
MAQPTYQNLLDENQQLRQENQRLREQNRQLHLRVDALEAQVLDHNDPTHGQSLRQLSAGRGMDVILEMLANINLATDLEVVAHKAGPSWSSVTVAASRSIPGCSWPRR